MRAPPTGPEVIERTRPAPRRVAPESEDGDEEGEGWSWSAIPLLGALDFVKPLSKRERESHRETVAKAIKKYGELLDEGIPLASRTHAEVQIWGTLAAEECDEIAECLIDLGSRFVLVAQVVRGVVRTYSYLRLGVITGPRFARTVQYYLTNGFILHFQIGRGKGR